MQAFNEEANIAEAVESLFTGGCERVVVVDGAWLSPDGTWFGGGGQWSTDDTVTEARQAGAEVLATPDGWAGGDGAKRELLLRMCGASEGDFILLVDADERLVGHARLEESPSGHACVIHRDLFSNDLEGLGGVWPRGDYGPEKPLLRWLRYSRDLQCQAPGVYFDHAGRIHAYIVGAMAARVDNRREPLLTHAYRVLRELEHHMKPAEASLLPIVPGIEIHHVAEPASERVAAKRRHYKKAAA